jgi:dihydrolipoamide dehydrogenase
MSGTHSFEVVVIGAGPAGTAAALGAAELGVQTALVTRDAFGGMSANEGPIPVRTLAHAARLVREARQLEWYGISVGAPAVDYPALMQRAREVVGEARKHSTLLTQVEKAGVALFEHAGTARFVDPHSIQCESGLVFRCEKIVLCSGGVSRPLNVPGSELTVTPADAFGLTSLPQSLLVVGAGATGAQVASIFNAFGTKVVLCQTGPRIVPTEDADISAEVAHAFRDDGIEVYTDCGRVLRFEPSASNVKTTFRDRTIETQLAVRCIGWIADTNSLNLDAAGIAVDERGFVAVDRALRTNAPHVYAAGDAIGRSMLVPQAVRDGYIAGRNATGRERREVPEDVEPIGSFTDPEYAKVGLTEDEARETRDVLVSRATYAESTRPTIDGRTRGFCKLVIDRETLRLLGCHIVGERAVEVAQMAAIAMTAQMRVADLAPIPLSFPTYGNVFGRAALRALHQLREPRRTASLEVS